MNEFANEISNIMPRAMQLYIAKIKNPSEFLLSAIFQNILPHKATFPALVRA